MNFYKFHNIIEEKIYRECIAAESSARTSPSDTAIHARAAIDNLFNNEVRTKKTHLENLAKKIDYVCKEIYEDKKQQIKRHADFIRNQGNKAVHGNKIDETDQKNVKRAIDILKNLHDLLRDVYKCEGTFDIDKVPFDGYEIIRKVPHYKGELLCDDYNYFVKIVDDMTGNEEYYYLQCLSIYSNIELYARREEASERIKGIRKRVTYLQRPSVACKIHGKPDRKIIVYNVFDDSYLLSENMYKMTLRQALNVGLDLVHALEDLNSQGMHHRNICPGCILVDPCGDDFNAYLINMQTAKIKNTNVTIFNQLLDIWDTNRFFPRFLLASDSLTYETFEKWDKVDIFSVGKIILYCMDPALEYAECTDDIIAKGYDLSDELYDLYDRLFLEDCEFNEVPTLEELKGILENEISKL